MNNGAYTTFIELTVGSLVLNLDEDHIIELTCTRITENISSTVQVSLYDDTAFLVESTILNEGVQEFSYRYGFVNGEKSLQYTAQITNMSVEFTAKGTNLTIEGAPYSAVQASRQGMYSYEGMNIDEIITEICKRNGWTIKRLVPCKEVIGDIDAGSSGVNAEGACLHYKKAEITFVQDNMSDIDFINNKVIPFAVSKEGELGDYKFRMVQTTAGTEVYFQPSAYEENDTASEFTYVVGRDNDKIIYFNPDYNSLLVAVTGESISASLLDKDTNEPITYDIVASKAAERVVKPVCVMGSTYTAEQLELLGKNVWQKTMNLVYPATMEIVGSPQLQPMQYIDITVLTPNNTIHHSSGKYMISSIEDRVEIGAYTSVLDLIKANSVGSTETVTTTSTSSAESTTGVYSWSGENGSIYNKLASYAGIPYVYGGESRSGTDCSGLIYLAFSENNWGSDIGAIRWTASYQKSYMDKHPELFKKISNSSELQCGDIIFWSSDPPRVTHVGFSMGNGQVIHAPEPGKSVEIRSFFNCKGSYFLCGYRYLNFP